MSGGQRDLFDTAPFQPHSDTSRDAAKLIETDINRLQAAVLKAIRLRASTDEELQAVLHMNPSTERPRRVELVEKGLIVDRGLRRKTASGRYAVVWEAVRRE